MAELLNQIITHPVQGIVIIFSLLAALAFVTFLRGFLSGLQQLIFINMGAEHLAHARTRAVWGVTLLIVMFAAWEVLRWILGFFT